MAEKIIAVDVVRAHIEDGQHSPRRVTLEVRREDGRIAYVSMPCDGATEWITPHVADALAETGRG